jgi:ketosteroid isomerase-like protein
MSQENLEVARAGIEALNSEGVEALLPYYAPDAVIYPFPEWVEASEYRGHDGLRAMVTLWTETVDDFALETHEIRDAGDQVVWLGWTTGRIKGADAPIRQMAGGVFLRPEGGLVREARFYLNWAQALEAAGLPD